MNIEAIELMQSVITNWKAKRNFSVENKQVHSYKSPFVDGEYILRFTNNLNSFFCNNQKIEISLISRPFHTGSLSKNPLSDNPQGDKYRLDALLEEFDCAFYSEVDNRLNDCIEILSTSDPLFF